MVARKHSKDPNPEPKVPQPLSDYERGTLAAADDLYRLGMVYRRRLNLIPECTSDEAEQRAFEVIVGIRVRELRARIADGLRVSANERLLRKTRSSRRST